VIRQRLVQVVPCVPSDTEVVRGHPHELSLRAQSLEEEGKLELEEDHWIDGGTTKWGMQVGNPVPYEREIERTLKMAIEVISGNERFKGDGDRAVELAALTGTEHGEEAFWWRG
jgi:hypothetical protein